MTIVLDCDLADRRSTVGLEEDGSAMTPDAVRSWIDCEEEGWR